MLQSLDISNIVLIERLQVQFAAGLTALTGETGAGKSILLDALGLALGERSDVALIRKNAPSASVTAVFTTTQAAQKVLAELGIESAAELILRRTLGTDGKSRAFVNDASVTLATLKQLASVLIEVEGQFGVQGLLDKSTHRALLDSYGKHHDSVGAVQAAYAAWQSAAKHVAELEAAQAAAAKEEQFLRHAVAELQALAATEDEEDLLLARRARLQQQQKLLAGLERAWTALAGEQGVELQLADASKALLRLSELLPQSAPPAIEALDAAARHVADAVRLVEAEQQNELGDGLSLEALEDRLYKLRAAARKYQTTCAALSTLAAQYAAQLNALDGGDAAIRAALKTAMETEKAFHAVAQKLSAVRTATAKRFDAAVNVELPALKLEKASFATAITPAPPSAHGVDEVVFTVAINAGSTATPIHKTASGGELARLLLALKVALADANPVGTLVLDEADTGLGGATAAAVGERLARLSQTVQIITITHSPQVAASAAQHYQISKASTGSATTTTVQLLTNAERVEEIARMLAGNKITAAARAAAVELLGATAQPAPKKHAKR